MQRDIITTACIKITNNRSNIFHLHNVSITSTAQFELAVSQMSVPVILTLVMFCVSQLCEPVLAKVFYLC